MLAGRPGPAAAKKLIAALGHALMPAADGLAKPGGNGPAKK